MSVKINGSTGIDTVQDKVYNATGVKNWIINGQFDVWQRGTSQTSGSYGSDDRFFNDHGTSTKTHSRQSFTVGQTDVPNNPTYFSRTVVTTGGTAGSYCHKWQKIEDVSKLAGKNATLSFWAKADSSKNISVNSYQYLGSGGSGYQANALQKIAIMSTWTRYTVTIPCASISGKTIGTGSYTAIVFWFDAGSNFNADTNSLGNQSGTFDIANVCLVEGSQAQECPSEPYAEVLRKCQRYYYRINAENLYGYFGLANVENATIARVEVQFPVTMRTAPTSIDYSSTLTQFAFVAESFLQGITAMAINGEYGNSSVGCISVVATFSTLGKFYRFVSYNNTSTYLAFSAELL